MNISDEEDMDDFASDAEKMTAMFRCELWQGGLIVMLSRVHDALLGIEDQIFHGRKKD